MAFFSIITITFNSEKTIERTLKSVLAQTYTDYEYIVVDGASKDSTMNIIRKYEPLFEGRMKWKSEPDTGIYNAMNKGIMRSTGELIGIVNSDDWLELDALESIYECFKNNNSSLDKLYCGWIKFHYLSGKVQIMKTNHKILEKLSGRYEMGGVRHPAVFVPNLVYQKYGVFDERMKIMADADLILRFYFAGIQFCYPEKVISNMSDGGVSNSFNTRLYDDYKLILQKYKLSRLNLYRMLFFYGMKMIVKFLVPVKLISYYRSYSRT